jgi:hypothetical protein
LLVVTRHPGGPPGRPKIHPKIHPKILSSRFAFHSFSLAGHSRAKKMTAELNAIIDDDWQWRMENLPEFATGTLYFICVTLLHALS